MLLPAEIEARSTIPVLRAMVAKKLTGAHGFTQQQVAKLLGVTQAAVSNYLRGTRGTVFSWQDTKEVMGFVDQIAQLLVEGADQAQVLAKLNEACIFVRKHRMMCEFHQRLEPGFDVDSCHACEM